MISNLSKKFGDFLALDNISFRAVESSCVGLLGPNGAGKSTIMKSITNIIKPTSGRIEVDGVHVSSNPRKALRNVGSLIETPRFYPYLTGLESLYFVSRVKGLSRRDAEEEIERVSGLTGVKKYLNKKTGGFSRGMAQRMSLASALIGNPGILILDEPTFGLDPKGMKDIRNLIRGMNAGGETLILLSSHLIYEINEVCDRVMIINGGKIAYDSVMSKDDGWMAIKLSDAPVNPPDLDGMADALRVDSGKLILRRNPGVSTNDILKALIDGGYRVSSFGKYDTLEETYISIVDGKP